MPATKILFKNRWFILACIWVAGILTINGLALKNIFLKNDSDKEVLFFPGSGELVEGEEPLSWIFSFPANTFIDDTNDSPINFYPPITGEFKWENDHLLIFYPTQPWSPGGKWTIELNRDFQIRSGLTQQDGEANILGPSLDLINVCQLSLSENQRAEIELTFNTSVAPAQLKGYLDVVLPDGDKLSWTLLPDNIYDRKISIRTSCIPHKYKKLTLILRVGMAGKTGNQRLKEPISHDLNLSWDLEVTSLHPRSSLTESNLTIYFSQPIRHDRLKDYLSIDPPIEFWSKNQSWRSSAVVVNGKFQPGKIYTVTLSQGLTSNQGTRLDRDFIVPVCFPELQPEVKFHDQGRYLTSMGSGQVAVDTVNLDKFVMEAEQVYPNNLAELIHQGLDYRWWRTPGEDICAPALKKTYKVSGDRNLVNHSRISIRDLIGENSNGVYIISLREQKHPSYRDQRRLMVISDIGISAHILRDQILIRTVSIKNGTALNKIKVKVLNNPNQVLAQGLTGPDGCVKLTWDRSEQNKPLLIIAQSKVDFTFLPLSDPNVKDSRIRDGAPFPPRPAQAYLYTDRGVYRPGETVHIRAILRQANFSPPPPGPVKLGITAPSGKIFEETGGLSSKWGTTDFKIGLPEYAAGGTYTADLFLPGSKLKLGTESFQVADFVPPAIKAQSFFEKINDDQLTFMVQASYFYGAPAAGNLIRGYVSFPAQKFEPTGWEDWHFGDNERKYIPPNGIEFNQTLNQEGQALIHVQMPQNLRPPTGVAAYLNASIIEESGRAVTTEAQTRVDVYPVYLGIRGIKDKETLAGNKRRELSLAAVSPAGDIDQSQRVIQVSLKEITWTTFLKKDADGAYSYVSERKLSSPILEENIPLEKGKATLLLPPLNWGHYLLQIADPITEVSTSLTFRATNSAGGSCSSSMEAPEQLEISVVDSPGKPGETAVLSIISPFPGTGLLEYETEQIAGWRTFTLEGNSTMVEFELDRNCMPGIHCTASVIRALGKEGPPLPTRAVGSVYIPVIPENAGVDLKIRGPKECNPQKGVVFEIELTDFQGRPVPGEVVIAAVDEGILSLTSFISPDPLQFFSQTRSAIGKLHDIYSMLLPDLDQDLRWGKSHPGGDSDQEQIRNRLNPIRADRFKPVSIWSGPIPVGESGKISWTCNIPKFNGKLRVMAVAATSMGIGSAHTEITVKSPLVISDSLPRFLAPGDRCQPEFSIQNLSNHAGQLFFSIKTTGSISTPTGDWNALTELGKNQKTTFIIPLVAKSSPGKGILEIKARLNNHSVSQAFEIPIRPGCPRVRREYSSTIPAENNHSFLNADQAIPGTKQLEVICSPLPSNTLIPGLDYLLNYPYGCLEQTVSCAFPWLYLKGLLPPENIPKITSSIPQYAIKKVLSRQLYDGGFSYWPGGKHTCEWGTLYATHFLLEAQKFGYEVPSQRLDAALEWCRNFLNAPLDNHTINRDWRRKTFLRSYVCLILAMSGQGEQGAIRRMMEIENQFSPGSRINLAASRLAGQVELATLPERLEQLTKISSLEPEYQSNILESVTRNKSLLLLSILSVNPDSPSIPKLVRAIQESQTNGRWRHTADTAMALMALGSYFQTQKSRPVHYRAKLCSGENVTDFSSQSSFKKRWDDIIPSQVIIENKGPGTLYLQTRLSYVPDSGNLEEIDRGVNIRREFLYPNGETANLDNLSRGQFLLCSLTLDSLGNKLDNLVIEDLIPAGMEIENPNLETTRKITGIKFITDLPIRQQEMKDDRLILFTGEFTGKKTFYYGLRILGAGNYLLPPVRAEGMYDPDILSINGGGQILVKR